MTHNCFLILCTMFGIVNSKSDCREAFNNDVKMMTDNTNSEIAFVIPDNTDLTSDRNMHHSVPIRITNHGEDPATLLILYDEAFPTQDILSDFGHHTHVELVKSVSPDKVDIDANQTVVIHVNFFIPDFVPMIDKEPYRSKVTVSAKKTFSNISNIMDHLNQHWKQEVSFYLTVTDKKLSDYDDLEPYCDSSSCPDLEEECSDTNVDNCESSDWHAEFVIQDNSTGLKEVKSQSATSASISKRFSIGTRSAVMVRVRSSCCEAGVLLTATDLAGNMQKCTAGNYPNIANPTRIYTNYIIWSAILFRTIYMYGYMIQF